MERTSIRRVVAPLATLFATAVLAAPLCPATLPAQQGRSGAGGRVDLVITATTDVHGRLRGWDYYANAADPARSLAAAATIVDSVRAANPGMVLLVDGGDLLQGNPLTFVAARVAPPPVHPVVAAMNVMQYDAAVLGNHEFNYGVPVLQKALSRAAFPFLAANVVDGRGRPFVAPWTLVERKGIRIAIIGATTPGSMLWDKDNLRAARLTVTDIMPAVRARVAEARKRKADVVLVLLHSGLDEPASYDTVATGLPSENVAARVAREIPGINAIVLGHSHKEIVDSTINNVLLLQPRNWAASVAVGTLTLARERDQWRVVQRKGAAVRVAGHAESPAVLAASATTHRNAVAWVAEPVGRTTTPWRADSARITDQPITDLVNEVMRRTAGADLSATAVFSLDAGLPNGAVTQADLSKLYPYDNTLRAVRISGAQLRAFIEHATRYYRTLNPDGTAPAAGLIDASVPGYNFDVVSGVDYTIDLTRPLGSRVTRLDYKGRAVQPGDSFTMALNNYRQGGGGGFGMLAGAPATYDREVDIRQLLIEEVRKVGTLDANAYATRNWTLEPAAARAIAYREQTRGRGAESGGSAPAAAGRATTATGTPQGRTLRVIAMADFHGGLTSRPDSRGREIGGAVALSAALRKAQRECVAPQCESLIVDGGDLFTGSPASDWAGGRPTVDAVNRFGITAGALGNHDFDMGQDTLRMYMQALRHAVLGANVFGVDGQRPAWVKSDTIVTRGAVKVGIVGAAATHTPETTSRRRVAGLTFRDPVPIFAERARALRAQGATVVVALLHDGARCVVDRPDDCSGGGLDVGRRLAAVGKDRPDVLVLGHAHVSLTFDLDGMPAVEAANIGRSIVVVDVPLDGGRARTEVRNVVASETAGADPVVDSIVRTAVARVTDRMAQPVATIAAPLLRRGEQYALGNLIADAVRVMGSGDFGLWNNGGIRSDVQPGRLTYGGVHEIVPFGNSVARVRLRGRDVARVLEAGALGRNGPSAHVSGLLADIDPSRPAGQRVVRVTDAAGRPLDPNRIYTLATADFIVENDLKDVLNAAVSTEFLPVKDIDMLATYLRRQPQPVPTDTVPRLRMSGGGR
ncbi:MAG: 5'-nucleotidase C-terminal domain-containing protein [Gemmatimonadetes bacterium]|nr:5'-nucleotidase C-terminal domain-containing protein [Gemmatimonadota bacterium]